VYATVDRRLRRLQLGQLNELFQLELFKLLQLFLQYLLSQTIQLYLHLWNHDRHHGRLPLMLPIPYSHVTARMALTPNGVALFSSSLACGVLELLPVRAATAPEIAPITATTAFTTRLTAVSFSWATRNTSLTT